MLHTGILQGKNAQFSRPAVIRRSYNAARFRNALLEFQMNRLDQNRPSLVAFLKSIKFSGERAASGNPGDTLEPFARLQPRARRKRRVEDAHLVRSAN
jgi:hypothetical protein